MTAVDTRQRDKVTKAGFPFPRALAGYTAVPLAAAESIGTAIWLNPSHQTAVEA